MSDWDKASSFPKLILRLLRQRKLSATTVAKRTQELGIEVCSEFLIALYQLGRELMGLPVNVPLGAGCWAAAMLIGIRILWILPVTSSAPRSVKAVVSILILVIATRVSLGTIEEAYRKQKAGEKLSPDTKALLTALGGLQRGVDALKPTENIPEGAKPNPQHQTIIQQLTPDPIEQVRTDATSLVRRMNDTWILFQNQFAFWDVNPTNTTRRMQIRLVGNLTKTIKDEYQDKASEIKNRLVGHIHGTIPPLNPRYSSRGELYKPAAADSPGWDVNPADFRYTILDLKSLLNAVEQENHLPLSCQEVNPPNW
jgi:hypothetical protein